MKIEATYQNYRRKLARACIMGREEKGWTQEQLVLRGGNTFCIKTVSNIESCNDGTDLRFASIHNVFKTLGVSAKISLGEEV